MIDSEKVKERRKRYFATHKEHCKDKTKRLRLQALEKLHEIKSNLSCVYCAEDDTEALDFHHRNAKEKTKTIAKLVRTCCNREKLMNEIDKCDAVCCKCHRKIHNGQKLIKMNDVLSKLALHY